MRLDPLGLRRINVPSGVSEPAIVFYGDSRMAQWPQSSWLAEPVVNLGIAGQTTRQILDRFDEHLSPLRPKVVVIHAGINDLKTIPLFTDDEAHITAAALTDGNGKRVPASFSGKLCKTQRCAETVSRSAGAALINSWRAGARLPASRYGNRRAGLVRRGGGN